ncbi:MAG: YqgE/AlgH family protein [Gammaproteobacteria bacterium]|nr:YqgE/AlgH family protein [Gammaproteobacteria bacterium]
MKQESNLNLVNKFLIAVPELEDAHFHRGVVYVCAHSEEGAMGLLINRPFLDMKLADVFAEMKIEVDKNLQLPSTVLLGGPLQPDRGFVLHKSQQRAWQSTLVVKDAVAVTSSQDILQAMAHNQGPSEALMILGYCGWTAGLVEQEIAKNDWLVAPADTDILFSVPFGERWQRAIKSLGFNPDNLSDDVGHA